MEYVILGLLLFKPMTAYEISNFIKKNLALICSSSAGSIQTALKKLMNNGAVSCEAIVEQSINKKYYSLTQAGKDTFSSWVQSPMEPEKVKNMELSKLFFLGFADAIDRKAAIRSYVEQMKLTQTSLKEIKMIFDHMSKSYIEGMSAEGDEVLKYQGYTIDYGIEAAQFEIDWYSRLLEKMEVES